MFSFVCFITSMMFQMKVSNVAALKGKDFQDLYAEKEELEKAVAYLEFQESNLTSIEYIEEKAITLGFVEMVEPLASIPAPSLASLYSR